MSISQQDVLDFIDVEYDTQIRQVRAMWAEPIGTRVAEGEAIDGLTVVQSDDKVAALRCRQNLSKFREGDMLRLHRGNPEEKYFECTLDADRGTELVVRAGYRTTFWNMGSADGWVLDRNYADLRHILKSAVLDVEYAPQGDAIRAILDGRLTPTMDTARLRAAQQVAKKVGLNTSQQEAYAKAFATDSYYLIQGPPGTGKTLVLAYLAVALAREGQRVLVTAFTHRAINNALRKIGEQTGYKHVMKIGQRDRADDLAWPDGAVRNFERFSECPYSELDGGLIIGGTCFAVRTSRLRDVEFDTVIFDEASQVTIPLALAGMLAGKRYIFIGDHQQMPPVITGEHRNPAVSRSIFEMLFAHAPGTMLSTTYRMNAAINDFPSRRFYGGRLLADSGAAQRQLQLKTHPAEPYATILAPETPDIFVSVDHAGRKMRSEEESSLAVGLVAEALRCGVPPQEVAIVAPYRAQGRLLRSMLREQLQATLDGHLDDIVVDTVERIQGQERDLIIISLTTSDPAHAAQRAEFYFMPNRLNVAITRARVKRIVIGSPHLLEAQPEQQMYADWVDNLRMLFQESTVINWPSENAEQFHPPKPANNGNSRGLLSRLARLTRGS